MCSRKITLALLALSLSTSVAWAQDATPAATTDDANTYTSEDGRLTLTYPQGWVSSTSGNAYFANSEVALAHSYGDPFADGEIQVSLYTGTVAEMASQADIDADASALELLEAAVESGREVTNIEFETPEAVNFHDDDAARILFTSDEFDGDALFVIFGDGNYLALQILTAPGEYRRWQPKVAALIDSIRYAESTTAVPSEDLALTETYSAPEDGIISVSYPAGWAARASFPPGVDIANSEAALDLWLFDGFAPGDVHLSIIYGTPADLFGETLGDDLSALELLQAGIDSEEPDERITSIAEPASLAVNDRRAAATTVTVSASTSYIVVIEYGDGMFVAAQAQSRGDEIDQWQGVLMDILATLEVGLPE